MTDVARDERQLLRAPQQRWLALLVWSLRFGRVNIPELDILIVMLGPVRLVRFLE